jgi:hypothetical protein
MSLSQQFQNSIVNRRYRDNIDILTHTTALLSIMTVTSTYSSGDKLVWRAQISLLEHTTALLSIATVTSTYSSGDKLVWRVQISLLEHTTALLSITTVISTYSSGVKLVWRAQISLFVKLCCVFHIWINQINRLFQPFATGGAGTTYPSGAPEFTPGF